MSVYEWVFITICSLLFPIVIMLLCYCLMFFTYLTRLLKGFYYSKRMSKYSVEPESESIRSSLIVFPLFFWRRLYCTCLPFEKPFVLLFDCWGSVGVSLALTQCCLIVGDWLAFRWRLSNFVCFYYYHANWGKWWIICLINLNYASRRMTLWPHNGSNFNKPGWCHPMGGKNF